MRKSVVAKALFVTLVVNLVFAGVVLGHTIQCYTAVGYTVVCTPKLHTHTIWDGGQWVNAYSFKAGVTVTQSSYGNFTWNYITLTDGDDDATVAYFGDAYVYKNNPFGQIFYTSSYFCQRVGTTTYSSYGLNTYNSTTSGYWLMLSDAESCYGWNPFEDYTIVWAY